MPQNRFNVLLIGAGNIGKHSLQSLLKMEHGASINVVDPSSESLDAARQAAAEVRGRDRHQLTFANETPSNLRQADLVIIATSSGPRFDIMASVLDKVSTKNLILEKFLFQDRDHYARAGEILESRGIGSWVSCPRPVWPGYQWLAGRVGGRRGNTMVVSGGGWNLASNAVHLLDCFSRVSGENMVSMSGTGLDGKSFVNKRVGYLEVSGQITARGENGGTVSLICDRNPGLPLRANWFCGLERYVIDEAGQSVEIETDSGTEEKAFPSLLASQLAEVYEQVLTTGTCGLSTYGQIAPLHLDLIEILNTVFFPDDERNRPCPVT